MALVSSGLSLIFLAEGQKGRPPYIAFCVSAIHTAEKEKL